MVFRVLAEHYTGNIKSSDARVVIWKVAEQQSLIYGEFCPRFSGSKAVAAVAGIIRGALPDDLDIIETMLFPYAGAILVTSNNTVAICQQ